MLLDIAGPAHSLWTIALPAPAANPTLSLTPPPATHPKRLVIISSACATRLLITRSPSDLPYNADAQPLRDLPNSHSSGRTSGCSGGHTSGTGHTFALAALSEGAVAVAKGVDEDLETLAAGAVSQRVIVHVSEGRVCFLNAEHLAAECSEAREVRHHHRTTCC